MQGPTAPKQEGWGLKEGRLPPYQPLLCSPMSPEVSLCGHLARTTLLEERLMPLRLGQEKSGEKEAIQNRWKVQGKIWRVCCRHRR